MGNKFKRLAGSFVTAAAIAFGVAGAAGAAPINVLQVGGSTAWNDGNYNITLINNSTFSSQSFTGFDVIYISGGAGTNAGRTTDIASFVSGGGGLVAESGGNIGSADFSWLPLGGSITTVTQHQDTVVRTALGLTHDVTSGISDAQLSGWGNSQHNYFTATGGLDVLATSGVGNANILAGSFGAGNLVYLGVDPVCCHLGSPGAVLLARSSVTFAATGAEVAVPEPAAIALLGLGLVGMGAMRRRRA